ncbi:MAG: transporter ATP-binding protein [Flaviaesturariibacter sp.]|nr:transporter ATP-binding protein [Flaviaesturariibacter sp.]
MSLLAVSGVGKQVGGAWVLRDMQFSQQPLQRIGIVGETGSGKSTLLKIIGGWEQATAGEVLFEGKRVPGTDEKLLPGHHGIAYLSQQYGLPQHLRVEQVLEYANQGTAAEGQLTIDICGIRHLLKRKTSQLSGGEQQRVALCRQLLSKPKLLLLDEPFSNLDRIHKDLVKNLLQAAEQQLGVSFVLISHDPLDILSWAHTLLVLKEGLLVQAGSPEQLYRQPINEYVAGLLGTYSLIKGKGVLSSQIIKLEENSTYLVRPEQWQISSSISGEAGQIAAIHFRGSYYELEVLIGKTLVRVNSDEINYSAGDKINLQLKSDPWKLR